MPCIKSSYLTLIFIIICTQKERKSLEELKTLDIGTRLLDNTAFVFIQVVERFSKEFLVVRWLTSRGFALASCNVMFYETFICFYVIEGKPLCFSLCSQMFLLNIQ